jgi:hypothetical protein
MVSNQKIGGFFMKKSILTLTALLALSAGTTVFAAPINNLSPTGTAIGIGTNESYIEHKVSDNFTLGYQYVDRDEYGGMNDIYGQVNVVDHVRVIVGDRSKLPGDKSNFYGGLAVNTPNVMGAEGYASYVAGSDFNETQVGVNVALVANVDLNINYHSFNPDHAHNENGIGIGATMKF